MASSATESKEEVCTLECCCVFACLWWCLRPCHIVSYRDWRRRPEGLYIPDLPDATVTVAHGGQIGLKVFIKKTCWSPNLPASGLCRI